MADWRCSVRSPYSILFFNGRESGFLCCSGGAYLWRAVLRFNLSVLRCGLLSGVSLVSIESNRCVDRYARQSSDLLLGLFFFISADTVLQAQETSRLFCLFFLSFFFLPCFACVCLEPKLFLPRFFHGVKTPVEEKKHMFTPTG